MDLIDVGLHGSAQAALQLRHTIQAQLLQTPVPVRKQQACMLRKCMLQECMLHESMLVCKGPATVVAVSVHACWWTAHHTDCGQL